jgi:hypothetical protein
MSDSKQHVGAPDRRRVAGSEEYEIRHFAKAIGLDVDKVRELIRRHGADRATLEREARKLKGH